MQMEVQTRSLWPETSLFDWESDVERLEREAEEAHRSGRRDDLALAEAECSLDLLDAEITALQTKAETGGLVTTIGRLQAWRARIERVVSGLSPDLHGGSGD